MSNFDCVRKSLTFSSSTEVPHKFTIVKKRIKLELVHSTVQNFTHSRLHVLYRYILLCILCVFN